MSDDVKFFIGWSVITLLFILSFFIKTYYKRAYYKEQAVILEARVVGHGVAYNEHGSEDSYSTQFNYIYNGVEYTETENISRGRKKHKLHDNVRIIVNKENPKDIVEDAFFSKWSAEIVLLAFSIAFLLFDIVIFYIIYTKDY